MFKIDKVRIIIRVSSFARKSRHDQTSVVLCCTTQDNFAGKLCSDDLSGSSRWAEEKLVQVPLTDRLLVIAQANDLCLSTTKVIALE